MYLGQKLAIDIGNDSIKILFGNSRKVFHAASIKTPEASVEDNRIIDIEKIYNSINGYILENKLKVKSIGFSLHGQDIVLRHTEIPIMERKKIRESVEWEVNQYLPDNGTNYYLDYEIIDKENTNEKKVYKILTAAAPKGKIDQYVNLSEMLNINLDTIDIAANCTARVFAGAARSGKEYKSIGIIDIGSKSSSIVVLGNGKLFMEREVPFGIDNLAREVTKRMETDMVDARKYIFDSFSFGNVDNNQEISSRIKELFDNVSSTFQKVIEFYSVGKIKKYLDEIFIIGSGSKIKGIDGYFGKYLASPVYLVDSVEKIGTKIKLPKECDLSLQIKTLGLLMRRE